MSETNGSAGNGSNGQARTARARAADAISALRESDLPELYRFWSGQRQGRIPEDRELLRRQVLEWMADARVVTERVGTLGKRLQAVLEHHLDAPRYQCSFPELVNARALSYLSSYDLEATLLALQRHALVVESRSQAALEYGTRAFSVPADLGDALVRSRRARRRGVIDVFSLRGYLDRLYDEPARAARTPPSRQRELYKMYVNEAAAVARVERLPPDRRALVEKAVMEFGGILPKGLYERMDTAQEWGGRRWGHVLEESLVGTVERLDLSR